MLFVVEGPLFVLGLVVLIVGRFGVFGRWKLRGRRARGFGLTLILPGLSPLLGILFGVAQFQGIAIPWILSGLAIWETLVFIAALIAAGLFLFSRPSSSGDLPAAPAGIWTLEQAAEYLRSSPDDVRHMVESGELNGCLLGERYWFDPEEVRAFLET